MTRAILMTGEQLCQRLKAGADKECKLCENIFKRDVDLKNHLISKVHNLAVKHGKNAINLYQAYMMDVSVHPDSPAGHVWEPWDLEAAILHPSVKQVLSSEDYARCMLALSTLRVSNVVTEKKSRYRQFFRRVATGTLNFMEDQIRNIQRDLYKADEYDTGYKSPADGPEPEGSEDSGADNCGSGDEW